MITEHLDGPWRGKPMTDPPKGIVIHAMGEYVNHQYAPEFLKSVGLSVHAFVAVDGRVLLGSETDRVAFHAGKSAFGDLEDLNNHFLGVEVLVEGHHNMATFKRAIQQANTYKEEQYLALGELCAAWIRQFSIDRRHVVGHDAVAGPDVRRDPKVDPGAGFDWQRLNALVDEFLTNPPPNSNDEEE